MRTASGSSAITGSGEVRTTSIASPHRRRLGRRSNPRTGRRSNLQPGRRSNLQPGRRKGRRTSRRAAAVSIPATGKEVARGTAHRRSGRSLNGTSARASVAHSGRRIFRGRDRLPRAGGGANAACPSSVDGRALQPESRYAVHHPVAGDTPDNVACRDGESGPMHRVVGTPPQQSHKQRT
jgi:hypothetical protein